MKLTLLILAATLGLVPIAAAPGASATYAKARPGLLPGTWNGQGTIVGSTSDGAAATRYSGTFRFRLVVKENLSVSGRGTWKLVQRGSGFESTSTLTGTAPLTFSGSASGVRFSGRETVTGSITTSGVTVPMKIAPRDLEGQLVITRPGKCKALGTVPMGPGVTAKWTALLAIRGTCNA